MEQALIVGFAGFLFSFLFLHKYILRAVGGSAMMITLLIVDALVGLLAALVKMYFF